MASKFQFRQRYIMHRDISYIRHNRHFRQIPTTTRCDQDKGRESAGTDQALVDTAVGWWIDWKLPRVRM